ncbi:MAG TPA: phenylalanine--tRNA ligase beta subunit-related protein, partial [Solirubrobacteraceae bacterium]|nr:phenylalanine--tRNA ligase beta subunit-related protein [Solirubrobacteraceae bacterium]
SGLSGGGAAGADPFGGGSGLSGGGAAGADPFGGGSGLSGSGPSPAEPTLGWCEGEVREELPGLNLVHVRATVDPVRGGSRAALRERLRELSNRWSGPHAINLRQRPVPAAYRVFFRHIGLDPDVARTPIEEAMLARMLQGGFHSNHPLADALLIALVDTGVPVWALDAAALDGPLGVRSSRAGETLGRLPASPALPAGQLVVADSSAAVAMLFGEIAPGHAAGASVGEVVLFTLQVPGVSSLHVEEALWMCLSMLEGHR